MARVGGSALRAAPALPVAAADSRRAAWTPIQAQAAGRPTPAAGTDAVVKEFHDAMSRSPDMAVAVAAIKALTSAQPAAAQHRTPRSCADPVRCPLPPPPPHPHPPPAWPPLVAAHAPAPQASSGTATRRP